jgi:hypothetical protein
MPEVRLAMPPAKSRRRFGVLQPSGAFRRSGDVRKRRRAGALQDADARCGICQRIRWFEGFKHGRAHGAEMLVHSFGVPGRVWKPVWKSRSDERAVARPFKAGNSQRRHTAGHPVSQSDTRTCRVGRTGSGVALRRGSWLNAITRILSRPSKAGQRDGCRSAAEVFKHGLTHRPEVLAHSVEVPAHSLEVIAQSVKVPAHRRSVTPQRLSAAPHRLSATPHRLYATPHNRYAAPHKLSATPHRLSATPHRLSATPHNRYAAPHKLSAAPHNRYAAPHKLSATPHKLSATPHRLYATPHKLSAAPHRLFAPPHRLFAPPHRLFAAPHRGFVTRRKVKGSHFGTLSQGCLPFRALGLHRAGVVARNSDSATASTRYRNTELHGAQPPSLRITLGGRFPRRHRLGIGIPSYMAQSRRPCELPWGLRGRFPRRRRLGIGIPSYKTQSRRPCESPWDLRGRFP